jgi:hypothetical protein
MPGQMVPLHTHRWASGPVSFNFVCNSGHARMPHLFAVLVLRKGRNFPHKLGRANLGMRSGG